MKLLRKVGSTSQILQVFIRDSSSTTGAGLTGLAFNTASLTAYYHRDTDTTATAISLVTMTVGTFTSLGFKEIDATNMPGWYQFCPPNAALASGAASVAFHLKGATNMAPLPIEVDLDAQVDVAFWNGTVVATPATAGIPDVNVKNVNNVSAASVTTVNANQGTTQPVNFTGTAGSALVKSDTIDIGGTVQTARDLGASVLLSVGTGTGQVNLSSGKVPATLASTDVTGNVAADLQTIKTQTVTCAAGVTVLASVGTAATSTAQTGDSFARLGAPAGASIAADLAEIEGETDSLLAGVIVTTNNDKTGYSLTQTFPTNFSALSITAGGHIANVDTLTTWTGATPPTGDTFARLGAPAGASVSADIAAVKSDTGTILTDVNTGAGAIYTRLGAPAGASLSADIAAVEANAVAIKAKTDNLPASPAAVGSAMTLTNGERDSIAADLLDLANGVETGKTVRQALRLMAAALAGKRSNAGTATEQYDAVGAPGTARIVGNLDASGNGTPTLTP